MSKGKLIVIGDYTTLGSIISEALKEQFGAAELEGYWTTLKGRDALKKLTPQDYQKVVAIIVQDRMPLLYPGEEDEDHDGLLERFRAVATEDRGINILRDLGPNFPVKRYLYTTTTEFKRFKSDDAQFLDGVIEMTGSHYDRVRNLDDFSKRYPSAFGS